jgi:formate hydrogenlyase transcriptional activator
MKLSKQLLILLLCCPPGLQPKLLRVLQEQQFERLGSTRTHQVDVRLVAATNRNLIDMVKRNEFRSDLY